ncbi:LysR family transcriptional regulator [Nocardia jiangsuensis]|uniref:LysR family transcriptional regulator n=1 Tax=Nocardia jiangsuensis TaxID=1691563 RepID=A0ABV8DZN2_9NOCA
MDLDLGAVRALIAVADRQHFGMAADELAVSQQAVSKRIARLETALGAQLLHRSRHGSVLTDDGVAFLPQARALIALADQAVESLRGRRRPFRIDVLGTRLAPTELIRIFHAENPDLEIHILTSTGLRSAREAFRAGAIDAAFARVVGDLDPAIDYRPAYLEPLHVLVGRNHRLAGLRSVRMTELADFSARMPGNEPGSEWADFYDELAHTFGLTIDTSGPDFGLDHILDDLAGSSETYVFSGEKLRVPWHPDICRVPILGPTPCYPHALLWQRHSRHNALPRLIRHIADDFVQLDRNSQWLPPPEMESGRWDRPARIDNQ